MQINPRINKENETNYSIMSIQSKFFQVTTPVLLEYRTDQYKITTTYRGSGQDTTDIYMYQADDGNQYCVEASNIPYTRYPDSTRSTFYYGGRNISTYDFSDPTGHDVIGSDMMINGRSVAVALKDKDHNECRTVYVNHDTIRLYLLTGYVMNSINGFAMTVKARVNKVIGEINGETVQRRIDAYLYLLDWYMPKEELKDRIKWLDSPLFMNSKFYDRYIEIKLPAPLDVALSDRNIDYVYEYTDDDGKVYYMRGIPDPNSNMIIEFSSVQPDAVDSILETDSMYECTFCQDKPMTFTVSRSSNANNFNVRIYEDAQTHSVMYYPVYGDILNEKDFDVATMQAIDNGIISMYDLGDADMLNRGMDDFIEMYGEDVFKWVIINELGVTYNYTNYNGRDDSSRSYTESYTNTIDYSGRESDGTNSYGEFWKSKFVPFIKERNNMSCSSIYITYTAHLYNRMNNIDIVRSGSMVIKDPYRYMSTPINTDNIVTYKIVNKIQKNSIGAVNVDTTDKTDKIIRSYYDATDIVIRDIESGQMYTNGKLTLYLTHSGNNYMLRLYTLNVDNTRVPYDLTGPYEYKLVFPSASGAKIEIMPNKDSTNYNLGIGSLIFYISSDKATAIMEVPESERYFSLMTHMPSSSSEESTLYEGKVEWHV